jgi:ribosome-binding protein aMBF1 (putative translation factor)
LATSVHTSVYKDLIQRLVAARNAAGLTQQAVADRLGKPQSYVAKVEGLERRLDVVELLQLAAVLEFDPMPAIRAAWKAVKAEQT